MLRVMRSNQSRCASLSQCSYMRAELLQFCATWQMDTGHREATGLVVVSSTYGLI